MSVVYLVRHAQASFGAEEYDRLSEVGLEQARVLGAALRERIPVLHAAVTGTQRRHIDTARVCLEALGAEITARLVSGFDEFDHDEVLVRFEPRYADHAELAADLMKHESPRQAFQDLFARAAARWTGGGHDAEYKESWSDFRQRCHRALDELFGTLGSGEVALVFTSGGPISAICEGLLGLPDEAALRLSWTLVNCGVTKLVRGRRGARLSTLNDHAHFEGAHRTLITYR